MWFTILLILALLGAAIAGGVVIYRSNRVVPIDETPSSSSPQCSLSEPQKCAPDNTCNCNNIPAYSCVEVSTEKPYVWSSDGNETSIPPGKWCLPALEKPSDDSNCPITTSDPVLYKLNDNEYAWGCRCKYNFTEGSSCDQISAQVCGGNPLYVSDKKTCGSDKDCGAGSGVWCKEGICYYDWTTRKELDPTQGICKCSPSQLSKTTSSGIQNYFFSCVTDTCSPGFTLISSDGSKSCSCPQGYIKCPEEVTDGSTAARLCAAEPQCVPDTCAEVGGFWDKQNKICSCPKGKYTRGSSNFLGSTCVGPCDSAPCAGRGTCAAADDGSSFSCENCIQPWRQDDSKQCKNPCVPSGQDPEYISDCCSGSINWLGVCE